MHAEGAAQVWGADALSRPLGVTFLCLCGENARGAFFRVWRPAWRAESPCIGMEATVEAPRELVLL